MFSFPPRSQTFRRIILTGKGELRSSAAKAEAVSPTSACAPAKAALPSRKPGFQAPRARPAELPRRRGCAPFAHLSMLITQRVMIEAVQHITSMAMKTLQKTLPKIHSPPMRSVTLTKGMTATATDRSAKASETMR